MLSVEKVNCNDLATDSATWRDNLRAAAFIKLLWEIQMWLS